MNGFPAPEKGPTLFQVQEQLWHAGGRVLLPALGLRRGTALRQPVTVGRVACGPPQRLQGFRFSFAPFGGGWFTCSGLTLRGLRCGWIQQWWAWRELLLVPMEEEERASHTPGPEKSLQNLEQFFNVLQTEQKTLWTPLQESSKLVLSNVAKQVFS